MISVDFSSSSIRLWSRLGMSGVIGLVMEEIAQRDRNLAILTADLSSYAGLDKFEEKYPDMYYNVGIAEQNMIGVACGMAAEGLNTFAMSYASFAVNRCFDQIKCGMGYMGIPVKLIGMASGYSIGILGATHMECNDITLMSSIPNMTIVCPADAGEAIKTIEALSQYDAPAYIRLTGGIPCPPVYKNDFSFEIGKSNWLIKNGTDAIIVANGSMVYEAIRAANKLETEDIHISVLDMHTVYPFDCDAIKEISDCGFNLVITIEEHCAKGGLGYQFAEELQSLKYDGEIYKVGARNKFEHAGPYDALKKANHLSAEYLVEICRYRL